MIEDLDGGDRSPSHARVLTAVSIVLAIGAVAAYGAVSSPLMRGPYATPDPSGGPARELLAKTRYTPAPLASVDPAGYFGPANAVCFAPGAVVGTTMFVSGRSVVFQRPIATSPASSCAITWLAADTSRQPWERFAP